MEKYLIGGQVTITKPKVLSLFPNVSNQSIREVYKLLKQRNYIGVSADIPNHLIESMGQSLLD